MQERLKESHYVLKVFDAQGRQRAEYSCKDDLKPRTAAILFLHFRVIKAVLLILAVLFALVFSEVFSHPL